MIRKGYSLKYGIFMFFLLIIIYLTNINQVFID
jgi:hypothetical protein